MSDKILQYLLTKSPPHFKMDLPPPIFLDMDGEFIAYQENEKLIAKFPNKKRYMNPFGLMQGGDYYSCYR